MTTTGELGTTSNARVRAHGVATKERPASTPQDVKAAFERLRANRWKMAQTTTAARVDRIRRLRDALIARRYELCEAVYDDYKKNAAEVELTEVFPVVSEANHAIRHLSKWMKPLRVGTPLTLFGTHSFVRYEAKGVVLILAPWNYPFSLLVIPLLAAISAGNVVAVRPSSKVPHTSRFIASFLSELFPPDEVVVFEGDHSVSDALLELPFDHVFFTGSPKIGKKIMAAAAQHLASVTLELGGKSPVIIDRSADIRKTAERVLWAKFVNAGQTCVAPDYVLVHESKLDEFVKESQRVLTERFGKSEIDRQTSTSFCRLVSDDHHRGLAKILDAAIAAGAKVATGGTSTPAERYLAPTLLTGVTPANPIMEEEIFGPILPIMTFRDIHEAVDAVRGKPKPLALYMFAEDKTAVRSVRRRRAGLRHPGERRSVRASSPSTRRAARSRRARATTTRWSAGRATASVLFRIPARRRRRPRSNGSTRCHWTAAAPEAADADTAGAGDFSPDGSKIVYSPLFRDFRTWKRYEGGWAQDLYIFDLATHASRTSPTTRAPTATRCGSAEASTSRRTGTAPSTSTSYIASGATTQLTRSRGQG